MSRVIFFKERGVDSDQIKAETDKKKLLDIKTELDLCIFNITQQLEDYKVDYEENGVSGDYSWFRSAKLKKKLYGAMNQIIQNRLKELKTKKASENKKSFERVFIDIAKGYLRKADFEEILSRTLEEIKEDDL